MKVDLKKYNTGWHEINIGLKTSDIDKLIILLNDLKKDQNQHFPIVNNDYDLSKGKVENIEFYVQDFDEQDNMVMLGTAIDPNDKLEQLIVMSENYI